MVEGYRFRPRDLILASSCAHDVWAGGIQVRTNILWVAAQLNGDLFSCSRRMPKTMVLLMITFLALNSLVMDGWYDSVIAPRWIQNPDILVSRSLSSLTTPTMAKEKPSTRDSILWRIWTVPVLKFPITTSTFTPSFTHCSCLSPRHSIAISLDARHSLQDSTCIESPC